MEYPDEEAQSVVLLDDDEVARLRKEPKGSGGFQSLFRRLSQQLRQDGGLILTPDLATVIVRYASGEYGEGGFQNRLSRLPHLVDAARRMEARGDYLPDMSQEQAQQRIGPEDTIVEDESSAGVEIATPVRYSIASYGADYPVDSLVKRLEEGDIFIPGFQRGFVWTHKQCSRFIESLLLGLPVPGVFLSREPDTGKLLVIDGQQRLRSLQFFYDGQFADTGRRFSLRGVDQEFAGLTYSDLLPEDRRQLDNQIVHATIVKQEAPPEDDSCVYYIFERINTGGTQLSPQEIRSCIYHGAFNELLAHLNTNDAWRCICGRVSSRMRDQELILRFLALYFAGSDYRSPMKRFLNKYMHANRALSLQSAADMRDAFERTIETIYQALGSSAFKRVRVLNAAVFDAVTVGVARRLSKGPIKQLEKLADSYAGLLDQEAFLGASQFSTADEANVQKRIQLAVRAFKDLR